MRLQMIQVGATTTKKIYDIVIGEKITLSHLTEFAANAKANISDKLKSKGFILNVVTKEKKGQVSNGEVEYEEFPSADDLMSSFEEVLGDVRERKKAEREPTKTPKSRMGGLLKYETIGGVFTKPNSINELGVNLRLSAVGQHKVPTTADRYVGVEIELATKVNRDALKRIFARERLHNHVNVGDDGSIRTDKGGSAHEVRIMMRESEVKDIMSRVCKILNSEEVEAYVNDTCGVHVHIDCRNRDKTKVYTGLVRGLGFLTSLVPQCRRGNRYCQMNSNDQFGTQMDKYLAVNASSFESKRTIEVRLHSGSTNSKKLINWITVLLSFANKVPVGKVNTLEDFISFTGGELTDIYPYLSKRIAKFKAHLHRLDTATDEMTDFLAEEQAV